MGDKGRWAVLRAAVALACIAAAGPRPAAAADAGKTYVMKLSTATLDDSQHEWMRMFVAAVEKDSGGRIKGEIYPASQLGTTPRQIEGTQLGAIQGVVLPPEFLSGVDDRFELLAAAGLIESIDQAERVITDPAFKAMFLALGADKGLVGVGLFISAPSVIIARKPVHDLAGFKGLKLRVLASAFQEKQMEQLGATPVAMTLGDVLPALQQGAIDGAVATVTSFTPLHFYDAAPHLVETDHSYVFSVAEMSKKWFDTLPPDLQKILVADGEAQARALFPWEVKFIAASKAEWIAKGGDIVSLPANEQAAMMTRLAATNEEVTKPKPALQQAYELLAAAAQRTR